MFYARGLGSVLAAHITGKACAPPKDGADLTNFTVSVEHLLLWGVYEDRPNQNDGVHLDNRVADETVWQSRWPCLATLLVSSYDNPKGADWRHFMMTLASEYKGILNRS